MSFSYPQERSRRRSSPPETTNFQSAAREHSATREHITASEDIEVSTRGQTRNHNVAQVTDSGNSHVNLNIDSAIDAHSALETQTQAQAHSNESIDVPEQENQSNNADLTNQLLAAILPLLKNSLSNTAQTPLQQNRGNTHQE